MIKKIDEEKFGFNSNLFVEHPFLENEKIPTYFTNYVFNKL